MNVQSMYNITAFGAVPSAQTIQTEAIQQAIDACAAAGGGTVYVPAGLYQTGALRLYSQIHLYIEAGATLRFAEGLAHYPIITERWEGYEQLVHMPCLYAADATDVTISGHGIIDGNGAWWWQLFQQQQLTYARPTLIGIHRTKNVRIEGVTCQHSPSWTVHPCLSTSVMIQQLRIFNPQHSPNTDGINPESCRHVHIANCTIDVGDDCIAIKAGTEDAIARVACENIVITNCTMLHGHGGVVIGSEMSGDVRRVTISNCIFEGTDRGIRLKTRRGRGGTIEDVRVQNVMMDDVICPFILNMYYHCGKDGHLPVVSAQQAQHVNEQTPHIRRIHFADITARNVHAAAAILYGLAESPLENITFDRVIIALKTDAQPVIPAMMDGMEPMKQRGFIGQFVNGLRLHDITIEQHAAQAFTFAHAQSVEQERCYSITTTRAQAALHITS